MYVCMYVSMYVVRKFFLHNTFKCRTECVNDSNLKISLSLYRSTNMGYVGVCMYVCMYVCMCVDVTCPGHNEHDVLEFSDFIGQGETYTNAEVNDLLDSTMYACMYVCIYLCMHVVYKSIFTVGISYW